MSSRNRLIGVRFGDYKVIEFDKKIGNFLYWNCVCVVCGEVKSIKSTTLRGKKPPVCEVQKPTSGKYRQYIDSAALRGHYFALTEGEFTQLTESKCTYCGGVSGNGKVGVDRKDNSKGYTVENCLPCCWRCNQAKGTTTLLEFRLWASKLLSKLLTLES